MPLLMGRWSCYSRRGRANDRPTGTERVAVCSRGSPGPLELGLLGLGPLSRPIDVRVPGPSGILHILDFGHFETRGQGWSRERDRSLVEGLMTKILDDRRWDRRHFLTGYLLAEGFNIDIMTNPSLGQGIGGAVLGVSLLVANAVLPVA